jgi:spermidine/putrescine transport system ATP-binding protein
LNADNDKGLLIAGIDKRFGDVVALMDISMQIHEGEFFTLLGPSGCGKTTLLRIIAGLELPDAGQVVLKGKNITSLPATERQVNTVFQSYALFPHLNIFENIAFGLRSRKFPKNDILDRVNRRLEMLGLKGAAKRYPHQLSGGQQQRVALARALVNEPELLLLDEPMSALDAKLRAQLQVELRRLQRKLGQTFILVTHDQSEALIVSDRLAVMNQGRIVQYGTPKEVYERPQTRFVAEFLGAANIIRGEWVDNNLKNDWGTLHLPSKPDWKKGSIAIRPERIEIALDEPNVNGVRAKIQETIYRGTDLELLCSPGGLRIRTSATYNLNTGDDIWIELPPERLVILDD